METKQCPNHRKNNHSKEDCYTTKHRNKNVGKDLKKHDSANKENSH